MKVFVINLDKDTEKLASITAQLNRLGMAFERMPAVYGKAISWNELKTNYSPFRWWCAVGRPIAPAEIGCALSHYGIYKRMTEPVCILEDDVILDAAFAERLSEVEKFIDPKKPQVVMLSEHGQTKPQKHEIRRSTWAICTDGYVITPVAAEQLLRCNLPMIVPCDHWWRWFKKGVIELYHATPSVVRQDQIGFKSALGEERFKKAGKLMLPFYKIKRGIGIALDWLLYKITGR